MSASLWLENLTAYSLQVALVAATGLLLPRMSRLRRPRVLYSYWQALLAVCLVLPAVQPWRHFEVEGSSSTGSRIVFHSDVTVTRLVTLPYARLIVLVLAGGVVLRLMWLALGLIKLRRYRRTGRQLEPLLGGVQEFATRLGVASQFCLSEEIASPVTFGLRLPVILLPPRFTEMDAGRQQAIASHELLHIARGDWAVNLAEEIVLAAFWFHPVVWWLVARIRLSREQVVDQQVVELTGTRKPYLCALLEIAAGPQAVRGLVAPAFLNECQLAELIRSLLREDFMSKRRIIISLACVAVLTLLAAIAIIHKFPLESGRSLPPASKPVAAVGSPRVPSNLVPAGTEIFTVGDGVRAPVPIYKPEPGYSEQARIAKLQGTVVVWAIIGADGDVKDVTVVKPLDEGLDQNAVNTIMAWKFKPAMKAGKPVVCRVMIEVEFRLF
jgi:TonB family protein